MPWPPRPGSGPRRRASSGSGTGARGGPRGRGPGGSPPPRGRPPRGRTSRRDAGAGAINSRADAPRGEVLTPSSSVREVNAPGVRPSRATANGGATRARRVRTRAERGGFASPPAVARARVPTGARPGRPRRALFPPALGRIKRRREKAESTAVAAPAGGSRGRKRRVGRAFGRRVRADDSRARETRVAVLGTAPAGRRPADEGHALFLRRPLVSPSQQRSFASVRRSARRSNQASAVAANVRSV
jgi:hypothetical protein